MLFYNDDPTFITEIKEFVPASVATSRAKLWPFLEQVERKYIKPLLEDEFFAEVQKYYDDPEEGGSGSAEDRTHMAALLRLIQLAEINLAYWVGFDILNVKISDAGFQRPEGGSFKGLYKYQEENLRGYFEKTGFDTLDDILEYLENHIEYFPEWEDSSVYTIHQRSIIPDTATFHKICDINKSHLIFLRLKPYMNQVLDFDIKPLLGNTVWNDLQAELAKESPSDKYIALRVECQKPLAFLSTALLIENTGKLTDRGLFFDGKNSGFPDNTTVRPGNINEIGSQVGSNRAMGTRYLELLRQYLANNDFAGYSGLTGPVINRDNTDKKTFWT